MSAVKHHSLREAIRAIDARLRPLTHDGISLSQPGTLLRDRLRAAAERMRRQHAEVEHLREEADRLMPALLDLYRNGSAADREGLREWLAECPSFRWGFGWGPAARIATAVDARNALAVFSMKDGGSDYRDQIVALDHLCAAMRDAGLPLALLLGEAAGWSSDVARFPPARSTRALLLHYAQRFSR